MLRHESLTHRARNIVQPVCLLQQRVLPRVAIDFSNSARRPGEQVGYGGTAVARTGLVLLECQRVGQL